MCQRIVRAACDVDSDVGFLGLGARCAERQDLHVDAGRIHFREAKAVQVVEASQQVGAA